MTELGPTLDLEKLEALLANVDRRIAASASPSAKARMYNLAGDLCFDAHQPERALVYYEHAVNTHVSAFFARAKVYFASSHTSVVAPALPGATTASPSFCVRSP